MSVLVPLRNEQQSLVRLYQEVAAVLDDEGLTFELVFIDDGSTDGSLGVVRGLLAADDRVRLLRLRRHFGKAAALATGFRESRGDYVVTIDADLQDDPAEIPQLLSLLDDGFDVVCGWKQRRLDPWSRRLASKLFNHVTSRASGLRLHDYNCGLKAYRNECTAELAETCYGELHRYLPMLAHWRGYRVTECAVNHRQRVHGRSRYGLERYVRGALDLITALFLSRYARRPMHVFGGLGLTLFALGASALCYLAGVRLLGGTIGGRPLLDFAIAAFIGGLQLTLTGVIVESLVGQRASVVPYTAVQVSAPADPYPVEPAPTRVVVTETDGASRSLTTVQAEAG